MSSANDRFMSKEIPTNVSSFRYFQSYRNLEYDYFCFVEGITDETFYSNTSMTFFSEHTVKYIYSCKNDEQLNEPIGKESVIVSCALIYKLSHNDLKKCVFIVDHDFFGLDDCKYSIKKEAMKLITVLPIYSFENYFMQDENLNRILKKYLNEKDMKIFDMIYNNFLVDARDYFALKRTICANFNRMINANKHLDYEKSYEDDDLFFFNFRNVPFFRLDKFQYEFKSMYAFVIRQSCLYKYYEKSIDILSINTDFIKGKILLRFLINYLKQVHEIDIDMYKGEAYTNLVKCLNVDMNITLPSTQLHSRRD